MTHARDWTELGSAVTCWLLAVGFAVATVYAWRDSAHWQAASAAVASLTTAWHGWFWTREYRRARTARRVLP